MKILSYGIFIKFNSGSIYHPILFIGTMSKIIFLVLLIKSTVKTYGSVGSIGSYFFTSILYYFGKNSLKDNFKEFFKKIFQKSFKNSSRNIFSKNIFYHPYAPNSIILYNLKYFINKSLQKFKKMNGSINGRIEKREKSSRKFLSLNHC